MSSDKQAASEKAKAGEFDAAALAVVFEDIEQEFQMLLKEYPALMTPKSIAPPARQPGVFRRNRQRR